MALPLRLLCPVSQAGPADAGAESQEEGCPFSSGSVLQECRGLYLSIFLFFPFLKKIFNINTSLSQLIKEFDSKI